MDLSEVKGSNLRDVITLITSLDSSFSSCRLQTWSRMACAADSRHTDIKTSMRYLHLADDTKRSKYDQFLKL